MNRVFIDGQMGTTGLLIHEFLTPRDDLELLSIADEDRKNDAIKQEVVAAADVVILCLPDDAAKATSALATPTGTKVLDASTAHRVQEGWVYGFPELVTGQRDAIAAAQCVSNPGCYPTGFLAMIAPLVAGGLVPRAAQLSISAVSGYSGGGRQMIERYEDRATTHPTALWYARPYALNQQHKHVPEMRHYAGLDATPAFMPSVGHYRCGMLVNVALLRGQFARATTPQEVQSLLARRYANEPCISVHAVNDSTDMDNGFLDPQGNNGTNRLDIYVSGTSEHVLLTALLDNLGKGASGAAVQNLNLMLGQDETTGFEL
jgi:N-acetyl-gamma-glutamyl-phosphate reductase